MISTRLPHYQNLRPAPANRLPAPDRWYATLRPLYESGATEYNCHEEIVLSRDAANAVVIIPGVWYGHMRHGNPVLAIGSVLHKAAGRDEYTVQERLLRPTQPDTFRQFFNNTPDDIYDLNIAVATNAKVYTARDEFDLPADPSKLLDATSGLVQKCVPGGNAIQLRREMNVQGRSPLELLV